ncbi:hypothetical protein K0504_02530 [Neiella marina]|uniref:Uncharacterized protein n=1 Tax=Neiella holothuriorum TaxID=2870530 RepID=A0ABS7ECF9_9GAMM|nr:hypothetical protein [Neiella holothuriorum]MBW8189899.1 hypothetical protein [Neiella holothuriorum]
MKKIVLFMVVIVILMIAAKNDNLIQALGEKPQQILLLIKRHVAGVTEYEQQAFLSELNKRQLRLSLRETNYVNNVSKTSGDLLMFINRHCDKSGGHLVLNDQHLAAVCKTAKQTVLLDD